MEISPGGRGKKTLDAAEVAALTGTANGADGDNNGTGNAGEGEDDDDYDVDALSSTVFAETPSRGRRDTKYRRQRYSVGQTPTSVLEIRKGKSGGGGDGEEGDEGRGGDNRAGKLYTPRRRAFRHDENTHLSELFAQWMNNFTDEMLRDGLSRLSSSPSSSSSSSSSSPDDGQGDKGEGEGEGGDEDDKGEGEEDSGGAGDAGDALNAGGSGGSGGRGRGMTAVVKNLGLHPSDEQLVEALTEHQGFKGDELCTGLLNGVILCTIRYIERGGSEGGARGERGEREGRRKKREERREQIARGPLQCVYA